MTVELCIRLLRSCDGRRSLSLGQQLHLLLLKSGFHAPLFVSNSLLHIYSRCCNGNLTDARQLFDEMPQRNPFSLNSLVDAYLKSNNPQAALHLFESTPLLRNAYSWNSIISGLTHSGDLYNAQRLLDVMPHKHPLALNSVIHGLVRRARPHEALSLYKKIGSCSAEGSFRSCTDGFVLATLFTACANLGCRGLGKQIHAVIVVRNVELDSVLGSSLVNMYAKCGGLDEACRVTDLMPETDEFSLSALVSGFAGCGRLADARRVFDKKENNPGVVLWNSMIGGYVSNGERKEALGLFKKMRTKGVRADFSTFTSVFNALESRKQLHACALKLGVLEDIVAASALIDSYSKAGFWEDACLVSYGIKVHDTVSLNSMINLYSNCGRIEEARRVFESIPSKSLISWNSMIVAYSQNGFCVEALELFREMIRLDLKLDKVAIASALSACGSICDNGFGEQIFSHATIIGLDSDQIVSTSLVDLYCKCGNVSDGRRLFDGMNKYDEASWNSMLMGYASNGQGVEVLKLFQDMRDALVNLNVVTFIAVLLGCCHSGMVDEGLRWFHSMKSVHGVEPIMEHHSCIVDMLVRSGRLEEAVGFIDAMPFKADVSMLTSVLGGCKTWGNENLGDQVVKRLIDFNPQHSGAYVQLSSMYAAQGEWERSADVRRTMREMRIKKNPGFSWIH